MSFRDKTDEYESRRDKVRAQFQDMAKEAPSGSAIGPGPGLPGLAASNIREQTVPQSLCDMIQEAVQDHDRAFTIYWESVHQMNHAQETFEAADNRLKQLVTEYFGRSTPGIAAKQR